MKHTVHVTVTISVEVDDEVIKAEYGKITKKLIVEHAVNNFDVKRAFDCKGKIIESYLSWNEMKPARKGIGSY
jgi:hypothetical protein